MIKVIDKRIKGEKVLFVNISYNTPFYFIDNPKDIYIVVHLDNEKVLCLTQHFADYETTDFRSDALCRYVDIEMIVTNKED